jgi:hypothetical protein
MEQQRRCGLQSIDEGHFSCRGIGVVPPTLSGMSDQSLRGESRR